MLETAAAHGFRFDTVQMPLNVMDAHFNSFGQKVLPVLVNEKIGVLGMKPMGGKHILESKKVTAVECLQYAMNLPTSVVITGCDSIDVLKQALGVAENFRPLEATEVAAILEKTKPDSTEGKFERYKTTTEFDTTGAHPEYLG